MRRVVQTLLWLALVLVAAPSAGAQPSMAVRRLRTQLRQDMTQIGGASGAYVVDLSTGATLFADAANVGRLPASVQKLYTTTTVLARFGPRARLSTSVFGRGSRGRGGIWHGTLYLRGGGDPTFGWAGFDRSVYAKPGATAVQMLVSSLIHRAGIRGVQGTIVGDESYFDSLRSTAESKYKPDIFMEGQLSGLAFDRGFADFGQTEFQANPPLFAAQQFAAALRDAGFSVPHNTQIRAGRTPIGSRLLTSVRSARMAKLISLTNTPSDNFMAEMLLKDLGAAFGGGGTTAAGVAVVRAELSTAFGIRPRFNDGSGLSYADSTTPRQVVTLLQAMAAKQVFRQSLAIAGETGTLQYLGQGTAAQRKCQGKTGSLQRVANLAGYCQARDGHNLGFAFLVNHVSNPDSVHSIEADDMAAALARYAG